ncbi:MAG: hypothetical protein ACRDMA_05210 [Solirubrobacterales bacterium]
MRRPWTLIALALGALVLALLLGACGDDDEGTNTTPAPAEAPSGGDAPPSVDALPPEFVECMEDQGIDPESIPDQIHSPDGDACFNALHGGGGAP